MEDKKETKETPKGFFASLTPEQQKKALEYRGDETFGDSKYINKKHGA